MYRVGRRCGYCSELHVSLVANVSSSKSYRKARNKQRTMVSITDTVYSICTAPFTMLYLFDNRRVLGNLIKQHHSYVIITVLEDYAK